MTDGAGPGARQDGMVGVAAGALPLWGIGVREGRAGAGPR